jgi:hypothetical protein
MTAFREAQADESVMISFGPYSLKCLEGVFSEVRGSNLRAPLRRGRQTPRRLSTMGVTPPNVATNRARKCSKV